MSYLTIKQGEYNFRISFVAKDNNGNYIDRTNSTPWFYMGKYTDAKPIYSGQCTLGTSPKSGQCYIDIPATATTTPGVYHGELDIIYPSPSEEIKTQELSIIILPSL